MDGFEDVPDVDDFGRMIGDNDSPELVDVGLIVDDNDGDGRYVVDGFCEETLSEDNSVDGRYVDDTS